MLLYTKIIYNINSLLYNYISAPFLFYIFFARLLKFVEAFFFSEFCWKSILLPVSRPKPLNSPRGSLRTLSLRFKILGRILKRKWTRFSRTSSLRIQMKAIIIMILLPQARLNIIFSSHKYDTNESSSRINKKKIFPSLSWSYEHSFQAGCMIYSSGHRLLFSIIERDQKKKNIQNISSFHNQQTRTKIRKRLSKVEFNYSVT